MGGDPLRPLSVLKPGRRWLSPPRGRGPSQTPKFLSPGPPSPWLPALLIERRFYRFCAELAIAKAHPPPPGAGLAGRASAARGKPRGCKGRSPLHKKTKISPFPGGEGGGGISFPFGEGGQESKLKARSAGDQPGTPPPVGTCTAGTVSAAGGSMQGCRGRSPRRNKLKISPFPGGEERSASAGGEMGAKKQVKGRAGRRQRRQAAPADSGTARSAGDQPGKPPCGHYSGKVSRRPTGHAPQKNHSSASSSRKAVTKPRAAASSDASAKIRRRGSVPENRQITKELSAK